ncbi:MAG: S26 family signal peptidase [Candidatus Saccharimonadales bacterium]
MTSQLFSGKPKNSTHQVKAPIVIRRVQGASMTPAYMPGQLVIALRPWRDVAVGDVIVFDHKQIEKIKRVRSLHDDGVYVVGDNTHASTDSRVFGLVEHQAVAAIVIWPKRQQ